MSKRCKAFFAVFVLFALLLNGCTKNSADKLEESGPDSGTVDSSGTDADTAGIIFEGTDLEGNTVSQDIFSRSRLTMVNVWATYCGPCLSEMPSLGELAAGYEAREFQIIGIISDVEEGGDQSVAEALVLQTGADYPHLLLNESVYHALLTDVTAVPTTFFVDENGAVLDTVVGAKEKSAWEETIHELLEQL